jgi:hypothetical protein
MSNQQIETPDFFFLTGILDTTVMYLLFWVDEEPFLTAHSNLLIFDYAIVFGVEYIMSVEFWVVGLVSSLVDMGAVVTIIFL